MFRWSDISGGKWDGNTAVHLLQMKTLCSQWRINQLAAESLVFSCQRANVRQQLRIVIRKSSRGRKHDIGMHCLMEMWTVKRLSLKFRLDFWGNTHENKVEGVNCNTT